MDVVEGQFAGEKLLAVVGIGVAMAAMAVASISQFELRLDHSLVGSGLLVDSSAERSILDETNSPLARLFTQCILKWPSPVVQFRAHFLTELVSHCT